MMRALESAEAMPWAMEGRHLERLLAIAAREHDVTPEALEAYRAKSLAKTERATVRDGVAILNVEGPLFKRANMFTAISGATSYDVLAPDLRAALDDPKVKAILLNVDSPGGEASGAGELAQAIFNARGRKPITAYVGGMGASAAYWIASAADRVVVDPSALLGSIGVQMAMRVTSERPGVTTHTFISSQSPMKNADPASEAGAKHIQGLVDAMASVFVDAVANHRGVSVAAVLAKFGGGGLLVGKDAVDAGLADSLGSFETALAGAKQKDFKSTTTASAATAQSRVDAIAAAAVARYYASAAASTAQSIAAPPPAPIAPVVFPAAAEEAEIETIVARIEASSQPNRTVHAPKADAGEARAIFGADDQSVEALVAQINAA